MQFTKQSILDADVDTLSPQDKQHLLDRYFPEELPNWKLELHHIGIELQYKRLWCAYQGECTYEKLDGQYRYSHQDLMKLSSSFGNIRTISGSNGVRVTDFTKWVMSLYLGAPNQSSLDRGKHIERSVARLAKPSANSDWALIYKDPLECAPTPLKISALKFNGNPLWGAPDLVYRNNTTDELIIVERKATDKPIPVNGWPNLKAQLWAYSHIDDFKNAPLITLIGEIWGMVDGRLKRRAVLRWSKIDKVFDSENLELLIRYGGERNS